jgi:acetyl-CoA synthetase
MTTGDQGLRDADGYLHFVGRDDDVITSAGYRIGPGEIEDCLLRHPAVAMAAVIGLPDEDKGSIVHAIVEADLDASGGLEAELREFLAERLVVYKIPRSFEFVAEALRDDAGKVRRSALRAARLGT